MKFFVEGTTGAIGRSLTDQFFADDHEVVVTTRSDQQPVRRQQREATVLP